MYCHFVIIYNDGEYALIKNIGMNRYPGIDKNKMGGGIYIAKAHSVAKPLKFKK